MTTVKQLLLLKMENLLKTENFYYWKHLIQLQRKRFLYIISFFTNFSQLSDKVCSCIKNYISKLKLKKIAINEVESQVLSCAKFLRTPFSQNTSGRLLLNIVKSKLMGIAKPGTTTTTQLHTPPPSSLSATHSKLTEN